MVKHLERERLKILRKIAREVYSVVHPLLGTFEAGRITGFGFGGDKTQFIDKAAEEAIVRFLERNGLSCIFIGEERGIQEIGKEPSFYLIADAVDGTTNAVRGISFVSTSLAASPTDRLDDVEASIVIDLSTGSIYEAERGKGARCNGKKTKPSVIEELENAVVSIDVSRAPENVEKAVPLLRTVKSVRSFGSAALEICHVASGLLDAYVDLRTKLRTLDIAAGMLILKESGGIFLQPDKKGFHDVSLTELRRFSVIAAANEKIYAKIASLVLS